MQFEVQLEAMGYWGVRVRAQVFERFLCIPLMSFDLSFNSFLLLVFELKCLRSYSEFNPIFSSVKTSQQKRMSHDFPNVALPGDKSDGYPAAGAASQLGKVWEVLPNPKVFQVCIYLSLCLLNSPN